MIRITVFAFAATMLAIASSAAQVPLGNRGRDGDSGLRGDRETYATSGGASRIVNVDPAALYREGVTALNAGKYRDAQRAFREALTREARDPSANFLMGVALANDTQLKNARAYLERAVRYKIDFVEARGWLGVVYAKTGDAEKAIEQSAELTATKIKCAAPCAAGPAIDTALKRIEDALADPAIALPPLPKIATD